LKSLGSELCLFKTANYVLKRDISEFENDVEDFEFPTDGLVLALDDLAYGESLGATQRHPKHSMAFKWKDISVLTKVRGMKWSVSQTGLITPVVLFDPVQLEGTEVKQQTFTH
jgi:DNA ligase (NAD+)